MQCNCERPSTENLVQIRRNGLLQKIRKSKTNCIFADGNQGWKSSLKNLVWSIDLCHAKWSNSQNQCTLLKQLAVWQADVRPFLGPFKDMASCQKGSQKSLSQRFEKPVQEPSFCMGVSKTNRKCYAYEIPHVTDCGLVNGKRPRVLKLKVVAQEADVYFSLWKPSQTSNPHVKTHMEAEMLKCYEILWFKRVDRLSNYFLRHAGFLNRFSTGSTLFVVSLHPSGFSVH